MAGFSYMSQHAPDFLFRFVVFLSARLGITRHHLGLDNLGFWGFLKGRRRVAQL